MLSANELLSKIERAGMWAFFHKDWLLQIRADLRSQLPPDYFIFVESETILVRSDDSAKPLSYQPDVSAARPLAVPPLEAGSESVAATAAVIDVEEECELRTQYTLLIRRAPDQIVVATLELLSPSNNGIGNRYDREKHLDKRRSLLEAGISLLEIDVLLEGTRDLPDSLERLRQWDRVAWTAGYSNGRRRLRGWGWNQLDPPPVVSWQVDETVVIVDLGATLDQARGFNRWDDLVKTRDEP